MSDPYDGWRWTLKVWYVRWMLAWRWRKGFPSTLTEKEKGQVLYLADYARRKNQ